MKQVAFSPDGRRIVTASWDGTARIWDVSLDDRSSQDWVLLAQLFGGRLDRYGGWEPLPVEKQQEVWHELRAKYPHEFTVTPAQAWAWHQREAEACLKEKNAAAALFHTLHSSWEWHLLSGWPRR